MTKRKLSKEPTPGEQREEKGGGESIFTFIFYLSVL